MNLRLFIVVDADKQNIAFAVFQDRGIIAILDLLNGCCLGFVPFQLDHKRGSGSLTGNRTI